MNLYEILQNSARVGEGMTHFERLFAQKVGGGKINEIFGVPPLRYIGDGRPLTDYRISGNTVQDGTPSADAPVDVVGCGVRTGNLFDKSTIANGFVYLSGVIPNTSYYCSDFIPIAAATYYFQNIVGSSTQNSVVVYDANKNGLRYERLAGGVAVSGAMRFRSGDAYIRINCFYITDVNTVMVNEGSTALPYEPYGYKLPLTVNGVEYPIYLGQVETTRRIKKLVLTGEETWYTSGKYTGAVYAYHSAFPGIKPLTPIFCTHLVDAYKSPYVQGTCNNDSNSVGMWVFDTVTSPDTFKSYLAQQYAAGTPVTVWYVLATPETAIANEPLMKIGDYADTVSFAQAGVTIPTVNGANVLDVPTEVKPSEVTIKGGISSV